MKQTSQALSLYAATGERKYLTVSERERFIAEAAKADLSTLALCLLLCLTGCRISEALALRPPHIDIDEQTVRFRTLKRRSGRIEWRNIPAPSELIKLLETLSIEPETPLFAFSRTTAWRRVKSVMKAAQIEGVQASQKAQGITLACFAMPKASRSRYFNAGWGIAS